MRTILAFCVVLAPALAAADEGDVGEALARVRSLRDEQSYREALSLAEALAGRPDLTASGRLDALRELAILKLILRDDGGARETLAAAMARDPGFDLGPGDHPPRFLVALADVRRAGRAGVPVRVTPTATIREGSAAFEVAIAEGADAVESVVVLVRSGGTEWSTVELAARDPWRGRAPAPVGVGLEYFVEARAPSGAVLATAGSRDGPLVVAPPPAAAVRTVQPEPRREPIVRRARSEPSVHRERGGGGLPLWVWLVGGAALVAGGVTVGIVATTPDPAREGTWGSVELGE